MRSRKRFGFSGSPAILSRFFARSKPRRGDAMGGSPKRVKSLILQGFNAPRAVVKKPFSGYNMSYFPHAVFRAGKRRPDSRKLSPRKRILCAGVRVQ
jgi:hypothetical protein